MQCLIQDIPLGRNIRAARLARHMTQSQVAQQLQLLGSLMSRSTLAGIESGRRNIKAGDLQALKQVLGVEYDAFFQM